jgi:hypothetical protein
MQIPAEIKGKFVRTPDNTAAKVIHITVSEELVIDAGSTIVINPINPKVIEIRKPGTAPLFRPYYLDNDEDSGEKV